VDDKLKRRLIGAAVLVSLAIIFVPMMVEEEPIPAPPVQGTNIPPREDLTFKSQILKEEVTVPTDAPPPEPATEPAVPLVVEPPASQEPAAPPVAVAPQGKALEGTDKDRAKDREKDKAAAQPGKAAGAAATPPKAPPEQKPAAKPTHWIVQVGNYATREKAAGVAGALKAKGLEAFVESIGQPPTHRVAVGPEEERRQADALLPKVRAAAPSDEKPFVRPWP
jgi:DedD protein